MPMNSKQYFVFSYVHEDASKLIDHFSTSFLSLWIPLFLYPMYQQWFLQYKRFTLEKKIIKLKYMLSSFLAMVKHGSYNFLWRIHVNDPFLHINYQIARIYNILFTCHKWFFFWQTLWTVDTHIPINIPNDACRSFEMKLVPF